MYPFYNSHNILFLNFHITPNTIHFLFISLSLSLSLSLHHNIAADNSHNPLPQPQPQPSPPPNITYTYLYPYQKLQPSYLQPTTTATTITTPNQLTTVIHNHPNWNPLTNLNVDKHWPPLTLAISNPKKKTYSKPNQSLPISAITDQKNPIGNLSDLNTDSHHSQLPISTISNP